MQLFIRLLDLCENCLNKYLLRCMGLMMVPIDIITAIQLVLTIKIKLATNAKIIWEKISFLFNVLTVVY